MKWRGDSEEFFFEFCLGGLADDTPTPHFFRGVRSQGA